MTITGLKYIKASNEIPGTPPEAIGTDCFVIGSGSIVIEGSASFAIGSGEVSGDNNFVIGGGTVEGSNSFAIGGGSVGDGPFACAVIGGSTIGADCGDCILIGPGNILLDHSNYNFVFGASNLIGTDTFVVGPSHNVVIGSDNILNTPSLASTNYNFILGENCYIYSGSSNTLLGNRSRVPVSAGNTTSINGGKSYQNNSFNMSGGNGFFRNQQQVNGQLSTILINTRLESTDTGSMGLSIRDNRTWIFEILLGAVRIDGGLRESAGWKIKGVLTSTCTGSVHTGDRMHNVELKASTIEVLYQDDPDWAVTLSATGDSQGSSGMTLNLQSKTGKNTDWIGKVDIVEFYSDSTESDDDDNLILNPNDLGS